MLRPKSKLHPRVVMDRLSRPVLTTGRVTSSRLALALLAALSFAPACDREEKQLTPEEAEAKLKSDLE